jgi:hypothetical protein
VSENEELKPAPKLTSLVGLRLSAIRRALDLLSLHFRTLREVPTRKGGRAVVGELAIHLSGAWRIDGPEVTLVGQQDLYSYAGSREPDDWNYEQGNTRLDAELDAAFGPGDSSFGWRPPIEGFEVVAVDKSHYGDLNIHFANGFMVRGFPTNVSRECWRLFEPGAKTDHLVVPDYD